jgi:hypothetical protein
METTSDLHTTADLAAHRHARPVVTELVRGSCHGPCALRALQRPARRHRVRAVGIDVHAELLERLAAVAAEAPRSADRS